jgi:sn-glycerol 3-phosphate transport system permease protein
MMQARKIGNINKMLFATLLGLIVVFPIYYAFAASFFSIGEFASYPPKLFPSSFSPVHYVRAVTGSPLVRFMVNSLIASGIGTIIRMVVAVLAAFAVAFFEFRGRRLLFFLVLGTMMLPADALIIENFLAVSRMGLVDTYLGIISVYLLGPVQLFMLRQSFKTIPKTYREIASMDGCSDLNFLLKVVLPLSRSIVLTLSLHSFVTIWNTYLWPLLVTNNPNMRTVQVGITMLRYADSLDFGPVFAAITIIILPSVVLFLVLRKRIVAGITSGVIVG